jgi:tetratricopeptide (TPR) repeat protein
VYNEYAINYLESGNPDLALEYALKADSIHLGGGVTNHCYTKGLLASIYLQRHDVDKAMQSAREALEMTDVLKDKTLYTNAWKVMSDVYLAQERYPEAEAEALRA